MKVRYKLECHDGWSLLTATDSGVLVDVRTVGWTTEQDVRSFHDEMFPSCDFAGVDFFTDAEFFG
jgi:hypothetical protein